MELRAARDTVGAIHLTLQGKGGVGKSLIASVLAQYFLRKGVAVRCVDTDPVNRALAQYSALGADWLSLRDEHNRIDQRAFDGLMERFLTEDGATFVVDNGASTFLPLWHYLLENNGLEYLRQQGEGLCAYRDYGWPSPARYPEWVQRTGTDTQERNIIVWVNEYFGRVEAEGKRFSDMAAYHANAEKFVVPSSCQAKPGHIRPGC